MNRNAKLRTARVAKKFLRDEKKTGLRVMGANVVLLVTVTQLVSSSSSLLSSCLSFLSSLSLSSLPLSLSSWVSRCCRRGAAWKYTGVVELIAFSSLAQPQVLQLLPHGANGRGRNGGGACAERRVRAWYRRWNFFWGFTCSSFRLLRP